MIKLKLSVVENKDGIDFEISQDELLSSAVDRCLKDYVKEEIKLGENFNVLVNGHKIDPDMWAFVKLNSSDNVLIAPMIKGGDGFGQILKSVVIMVAALVVSPLVYGPLGLAAGSVGAALVTAGVTIAASLLMNALIPPPNPDIGGDSAGGNPSSSQMYSINGQSNAVKRYQTVPKVYGTHRIFPNIAASPYTELETDPDTGNLIQYFYAIYDFGLGPMDVRDIKIGETPITEFSDVEYRLVDPNKPLVSEGSWDDDTRDTFELYKGDVERESVSYALNSDESPSTPVDEYQVVRNAPTNSLNDKQEINITMVNPSGLYGFSATGQRSTRAIDLTIEFSKVGEDIWRGFNDPTYVDSFEGVGGSPTYSYFGQTLYSPGVSNGGIYPQTKAELSGYTYQYGESGIVDWFTTKRFYGLLKGANSVVLATDANIIGKNLFIGGEDCGIVTSGTLYSGGYTTYTFSKPLEVNVTLFTFFSIGPDDGIMTPEELLKSDISTTGKVYYRVLNVGQARIERNESGAVYSTFKFTPKDIASFKIRITRKSTSSQYTNTVADALTFGAITCRFDRSPINTDKRHVFMEIRIRATNQLNGTIQNLSAVCSSVLDTWNGSAWEKQITSNPAWVYCDLLTGEINKRAISKSRLHIPSIVEWADFCDEVPTPPPSQTFTYPRFTCNMILDYNPTLQASINQIANAAQASLNIVDGKYGVLVDKLKTVPVQIFTNRNSRDFGSSRSYTLQPHALKVSYIDPTADWEPRETIVYDNGYTEANATFFDELESFACTNPQQAWRFGRYMLAQNRLRQEKISITVDFENLVCTRGDYVQYAQDVMKTGGTPARVKTVSGNQITIDDGIETGPYSYGYVFRAVDGGIHTNTLTVVNSDTFNLNGSPLPQVGDLIVIGVVGSIVMDCIVKSIDPNDGMSATLILVEKADAIYDSESTDTMPAYSPQISPTTDTDFAPPSEVENLQVVDNFYECNGNALDYKVTLDWDVPAGAAYEIFEVYVDSGRGYNFESYTKDSIFTYKADRANLGINHKFKVLAVSATGKKLDLGSVGEVSQTISVKTDPPSDISTFNADITGEVLQLSWTKIPDCSCQDYLIRYSPTTNGSWDRSIPMLRVGRDTNLTSTQARTGTYLIKAVDFEGNESLNATTVITTIPNLFGLNVIDETTDFPALNGSKERVEVSGGLILDTKVVGGVDTSEYYSDGYYYYQNLLDLGEIYTVRLQSLIQAEGYTLQDLMSNWITLDAVDALAHAGSSDWDVETEYRTTDQFNTIADWVTLSSIDPISQGTPDQWTVWKKFTIGDATGRIFAFRLRLVSNKLSVTPRVFDGTIRSDMPDRIESYNNLSAPTGGLLVSYVPSFKGPNNSPNIQISIESAQSGDYWSFDYKTLDGFYIRFFDKDNNPVARTFDSQVKGYGRKATAVI